MISLKTRNFGAIHDLMDAADQANVDYSIDDDDPAADFTIRYSKILNGYYIIPTSPQAELWLMAQSHDGLTVHDGPIPS